MPDNSFFERVLAMMREGAVAHYIFPRLYETPSGWRVAYTSRFCLDPSLVRRKKHKQTIRPTGTYLARLRCGNPRHGGKDRLPCICVVRFTYHIKSRTVKAIDFLPARKLQVDLDRPWAKIECNGGELTLPRCPRCRRAQKVSLDDLFELGAVVNRRDDVSARVWAGEFSITARGPERLSLRDLLAQLPEGVERIEFRSYKP